VGHPGLNPNFPDYLFEDDKHVKKNKNNSEVFGFYPLPPVLGIRTLLQCMRVHIGGGGFKQSSP
jgi:hypothetical protein